MAQPEPHAIRNVALYIRYSTEEQRTNSFSEETQRDECLKKLQDTYGPGPFNVRTFKDLAVSGAVGLRTPDFPGREYRQGLTDLIHAIADGEVDLVLCYAQDRLTRDEFWWHYLNTLIFQRHQIPLLMARDGHDISTDEGQMLSSFHAMVASLERRKISRNLQAAARRRAAEGFFGGLPPFGWQWDPAQERRPRERRRLVRNEAQGAVLLEIKERYLAGWPTVAIARDLHRRGIGSSRGELRWSVDLIAKVLRNPVHAGLISLKGEVFPGQHAELSYWSAEERELLLQRMAERSHRRVKGPSVEKYLLSGVLYCGHCGHRLIGGHQTGREQRTYRCISPRTNGQHRVRRHGKYAELRSCPGLSRDADELEAAVVDVIAELSRAVTVQTAAREQLEQALTLADRRIAEERLAVEGELTQVREGFSRLFELLDRSRITDQEFDAENRRRRDQEQALQARLDELTQRQRQRQGRKAQLEAALALLSDFDGLWQTMSQAERRQLLLQVDSHMTLRRDGEDVVLTISPGFADPLKRVFVFRPRTPLTARRPAARLTPRQLALLCCWQDGQGLQDIAASWEVGLGTVRTISLTLRNCLGVDDLDTAVELVQDRLGKYRATLPLAGRCKQRVRTDGRPLSEPLLDVLQLMAEDQGCLAIATALGKDKSTVSRQMRQVIRRLGVECRQDAIAKAREMGLLATRPLAASA